MPHLEARANHESENVRRWNPNTVRIEAYQRRYCDIVMYALCTRVFSLCTGIMYGIMYGAAGAWNDYVRIMYGGAANANIMYALCTRGFLLCTALCTGPACIMYGAAGARQDI